MTGLAYNIPHGSPVMLRWLDSCRTLDECSKNDWEVCVCLDTCGWFVGEDSECVFIAQDINQNNKPTTYRSVLSIVKDNIKRLTVLYLGNQERAELLPLLSPVEIEQ